ncbi:hypothetical protein BEN35_21870 [Streptomyces fradiae]|nr:hypothetical protein BEN35_21870 [Streptomyces fradiae]
MASSLTLAAPTKVRWLCRWRVTSRASPKDFAVIRRSSQPLFTLMTTWAPAFGMCGLILIPESGCPPACDAVAAPPRAIAVRAVVARTRETMRM